MDRDSRPDFRGVSSRPLPLIGVRRVIVQSRAHDDDRTAPALAPGDGIGVFFSWDRIGGFVDSGPKTLVPSASNRSTPEWTLVDSVDCHPRAIGEAQGGSLFQQPAANGGKKVPPLRFASLRSGRDNGRRPALLGKARRLSRVGTTEIVSL